MLKQVTLRKCIAEVTKPDGSKSQCVFGDYETIMTKAVIYNTGEVHYNGTNTKLNIKHPAGYILEDDTKIMFEYSIECKYCNKEYINKEVILGNICPHCYNY